MYDVIITCLIVMSLQILQLNDHKHTVPDNAKGCIRSLLIS